MTVHFDVTERQGTPGSSVLASEVPGFTGASSAGCLMVPSTGNFTYTLNTAGFQADTYNTSRFFRCCAWVEYNSSPGVPAGMEDVLLQSH